MAGYLAADTELNVWRSKCQEWRTASNALSELGRMWWSNKHMQWPGLTVYCSPCTHSLALVYAQYKRCTFDSLHAPKASVVVCWQLVCCIDAAVYTTAVRHCTSCTAESITSMLLYLHARSAYKRQVSLHQEQPSTTYQPKKRRQLSSKLVLLVCGTWH
jgi:hypothetical protein